MSDKIRCQWALNSALECAYHDQEWGIPQYDDAVLFEFLLLESAQAGLSWLTVLKKREAYRQAFAQFDPQQVAQFDEQYTQCLLQNAGIIRHRGKIEAAVHNAQQFLQIQAEYGCFADYLWQFVAGQPMINQWTTWQSVPAKTQLSEQIAKDLKRRGMRFFGPTICYAYLQAVGVVNDHTVDCFRYSQV